MNSSLKRLVTKSLLALGLDIKIKREPLRFLTRYGVRTVLDVGANEGQFATEIRKILPEARIYSFEPLPDPFAKLKRAHDGDPEFEAFNLALGSHTGESDFEMNDFSPSSSMLKVNNRHVQAFPQTGTTRKVKVKMSTLDDGARGRRLEDALLIKLDVQASKIM